MKMPTQFADLLQPKYRFLCDEVIKGVGPQRQAATYQLAFVPGQNETPFVQIADAIDPVQATKLAQFFSKELGGLFPRIDRPIKGYIHGEDFHGDMGQFTRSMFCDAYTRGGLRSPGGHIPKQDLESIIAALIKLDLMPLVTSESLWHFSRNITGYDLQPRERSWFQMSEYEHGDYFAAHNDLIVEETPVNGKLVDHIQYFADLHMTFLTPHNIFQGFMYQNGRHFNGFFNAATNGSITMYRLPFWHQVTPMQADEKQRAKARRWLIMTGFRCTYEQCKLIDKKGANDTIIKGSNALMRKSLEE